MVDRENERRYYKKTLTQTSRPPKEEIRMRDFWAFRTMVTPVIIQILFWIGTVLCLIFGTFMIIYGSGYFGAKSQYLWKGVLLIILGPLGVRVYCEILMIFFRINETLTEIKHIIERPAPQPTRPEAA